MGLITSEKLLALLPVLDKTKPFYTKYYPLYDVFLQKPTECPKCHSPHLMLDDCYGHVPRAIEVDLFAIYCLMCGWRFELAPRLTELEPDTLATETTINPYLEASDVYCCVEGCTGTVANRGPKVHHFCRTHWLKMDTWKRAMRRGFKSPVPLVEHGGVYYVNPERAAYEEGNKYQRHITRSRRVRQHNAPEVIYVSKVK